MANYCTYTMRLYGKRENLEKAIRPSFAKKALGITLFDEMPNYHRVYDAEVIRVGDGFADVYGTCAWSLSTSLMRRGFAEHLANLGLDAVAIGIESGCCFQERYLIANGELLVDEEQHWLYAPEEWFRSDEDYETYEDYAAFILDVKKDKLEDYWCEHHEAYCLTSKKPCGEYLGLVELAPEQFYELAAELKAKRAAEAEAANSAEDAE